MLECVSINRYIITTVNNILSSFNVDRYLCQFSKSSFKGDFPVSSECCLCHGGSPNKM
jgi:hypothetical protein